MVVVVVNKPSADKKGFAEKYALPVVLALIAVSGPITAAVIADGASNPHISCAVERAEADRWIATRPDYRLPESSPAQQVCDINGYLNSPPAPPPRPALPAAPPPP